jgi:hypothetical protein
MKRSLLVIAAAVCGAVLLAGCGEKSEPSLDSLAKQYRKEQQQAIVGHYAGRLHQHGREPFQVTATVASLNDAKRNPVHYTGIDCSGTWAYERRDGAAYVFAERIGKGKSLGANRYRYRFEGGGVTSAGTLRRTE